MFDLEIIVNTALGIFLGMLIMELFIAVLRWFLLRQANKKIKKGLANIKPGDPLSNDLLRNMYLTSHGIVSNPTTHPTTSGNNKGNGNYGQYA